MFKLTGSLLGLLLLVLVFPVPVMAANYVGASFGEADVDAAGFANSDAYKVFGGSRFGTFGVEGAYIKMDDFNFTGTSAGVSVDGIELSGMAYYNLAAVTLFAKAGVYFWDAQASISGLTLITDDGVDPTFGVGALYKFAAIPFSLRAEYQFFQDISGADIDMWSVGAQFSF